MLPNTGRAGGAFPSYSWTWRLHGPVSACRRLRHRWSPSDTPVLHSAARPPSEHQVNDKRIPSITEDSLLFSRYGTCSTMDAKRPRANPHSSSRVMTADPSLMTTRCAFFNWLRCMKAPGDDEFGAPSVRWSCRRRSSITSALWNNIQIKCLFLC